MLYANEDYVRIRYQEILAEIEQRQHQQFYRPHRESLPPRLRLIYGLASVLLSTVAVVYTLAGY